MLVIETKHATDVLKKAFSDLSPKQVSTAVSRAINHTIAKTRTTLSKEVRSMYKIAASDVSEMTQIRRSTPSTMTAKIMASATPLQISKFNPVQNTGSVQLKRTGGKKGGFTGRLLKRAGPSGVTIEILRGKKETIPSAFLLFQASGRAAVMARGGYSSKKFAFLKPRLPISGILTKSIYFASITDNVQERVMIQAQEDYVKRLEHELTKGLNNAGTTQPGI